MIPANRRSIGVVIAVAMILLAAACAGGPPPVSPASGTSVSTRQTSGAPSAVGYSACIRAHGIPDFPDPGPDGRVPKTSADHLGVSDARLRAAEQSCRGRYPASTARGHGRADIAFRQCEETADCPQALVQQAMTQLRRFSRCMRSHGLVRFPDPVLDAQSRPELYIRPWRDGFDPDSARFANTEQDCESLMHPLFTPPLAIYLRDNN